MESTFQRNQAYNPYLPTYEYIPDGEPHIFENRLYIYGSHDVFSGNDFCEGDYVCWSAPLDNLGDWRFEGVIYDRNSDPMNQEGKMMLCAPDVVKGLDGRYYLYYVLSGTIVVSVAVCDSPAGKYQFYGYVKKKDGSIYGSHKGDVNNFDPAVFRDNDGRLYLYTGFSPDKGWLKDMMDQYEQKHDGAYCMELEQDMLTIRNNSVCVAPGIDLSEKTSFEGHAFFEASSMTKINGIYYFVYSSVLSHELCYATSKYPDQGFEYGGTLISIGDIGYHGNTEPLNYMGNTHGGMVEIEGQWYIFYHRQTNKQKCCRQGCAEPLHIESDGTIPQVEMTSCGLNGKPLWGQGRYGARIACNLGYKKQAFSYLEIHEIDEEHPYFTQSGVDNDNTSEQYIKNMRDGAWAGFKYFTFSAAKQISVKVRGDGNGIFSVYTQRHGRPIGTIFMKPSKEWKEYLADLEELNGDNALYFKYQGSGAIDFLEFEVN